MAPLPRAEIVFFGDQLAEYHSGLSALMRNARDQPLLRKFLDTASETLQQELIEVASRDHRVDVRPTSLTELCTAIQNGQDIDPVLSGTLLYIFQMGCYLCKIWQDAIPRDISSTSEVVVLGLCTGLIPAAAIAAAKTPTQLLEIGVELVRFSVRINAAAKLRTNEIEDTCNIGPSAVIVSGTEDDLKLTLEVYHERANLPPAKRVYISATSERLTTISGPPSALAAFLEHCTDQLGKQSFLPLRSLFHANHLRSIRPEDLIPENLRGIPLDGPRCLVVSTSTGKPLRCDTLDRLLEAISTDILQNVLRVDTVVDAIATHVIDQGIRRLNIFSIGGQIPGLLSGKLESLNAQLGITIENVGFETMLSASTDTSGNDIAIVGMAGRFPGAVTLEEFWQVFIRAQKLHSEIPKDRFDIKTHYDPSGKLPNSTLTPYGCFLDSPGDFDTRLFNMSPREAMQTDPQQRLALLTTYEALENAGYVPNRTSSTKVRRIGTFFGQSTDDYRECNASQDIDTYYATGGLRPFGPGRISYHFGWEGPSYSIDTVCSSSLTALHLACTSILNQECGMAVVGGMNLLASSPLFAGLSRGSFLSQTGGCKTFDDKADGYCRGEAVATVIIKRLKDAISDNDNVLGVIKATARNHSGETDSITRPDVATQERLFNMVLSKAGVEPEHIDYVETHGTGTQAGDAAEMSSLTNVLAPSGRKRSLYLGSVKPNLGHSEAASGITSLMRSLMMLKEGIITPATAGVQSGMNHNFPDLTALNVVIPQTQVAFKKEDNHKRRVMVNNFDAAAGNTAVLLEEFREVPVQGIDPRKAFVVTVSAKTVGSLQDNLKNLLRHLEKNTQLSLGDLSYTTVSRRMHHLLRKSFACTSISEAKAGLESCLKSISEKFNHVKQPQMAFTFAGQGSNSVGLGTQLFNECATFRSSMLRFNDICKKLGFLAIIPVIDGSDEVSINEVQRQLGLVAVQLALVQLWRSYGLEPNIVIGHSLGEYAALCTAGVLSISDTFYLVGKRANLMMKACIPGSHGMLAVHISGEDAAVALKDCGAACEIACFNGPATTVLSGPVSEIHKLEGYFQMKAVRAARLEVPFAFHSDQLRPIMADFEKVARGVEYKKPRIPVLSTMLAQVVMQKGVFNASYLANQMREPVQFLQALEQASASKLVDTDTLWFELGTSTTLKMIHSVLGTPIHSSAALLQTHGDSWHSIADGLSKAYNSGVDIEWSEYHRQYERAHRLLELPNYSFELKKYWIPYRHDWCMTKGLGFDSPARACVKSKFSTSSLQRVVKHEKHEGSVMAVFESDLCEPALNAAVKGHLVGGMGLCPSSVYADMAYSAAKYLRTFELGHESEVPAISIEKMEIFHPLIADNTVKTQLLRIEARTSKASNDVEVLYSSSQNSEAVSHAKCTVKYGDSTKWTSKWQKDAWLIQSRIHALKTWAQEGKAHHLLRPVIYRVFSSLVQYERRYQGLEQVWMDAERFEVAGKIKLQPGDSGGKFLQPPYWIDVFVHLAGFVLNGSEAMPDDSVYISNGWKSMKFTGSFSAGTIYWAHVRMQPSGERGEFVGDVCVFEETMKQTVFACDGVKFQQRPKHVLFEFLTAAQSSSSTLPSRKHLPTASPASSVTPEIIKKEAPAKKYPTDTTKPPLSNVDVALEIIAGEIGVPTASLTDSITFGELGVDSLLSLLLLGKLRAALGALLPTSILSRYSTIQDFKTHLARIEKRQIVTLEEPRAGISNSSPENGSNSLVRTDSPPDSENYTMDSSIASPADMTSANEGPEAAVVNTPMTELMGPPPSASPVDTSAPVLSAEAVFLQGNPSANVAMFLYPDGMGSASSFVNIPSLDADVAIYGMHSPFTEHPETYTMAFIETMHFYVAAIRAVRPHGPYIFGGYSIGGSYAYECAVEMIEAGEQVLAMLLIDAPCRLRNPPITKGILSFLSEVGIMNSFPNGERIKDSDIVGKHVKLSLSALDKYKPRLLEPAKRPKAYIIWCNEGVIEWAVKKMGDQTPAWEGDKHAESWFMYEQTDFGPRGWEALLDVTECVSADGNHITIMVDPQVFGLGRELTRFLGKILPN